MDLVEFLDGLAPDELAELHRIGRKRRWPVGATLFGEGDRSTAVMLVLAGRIKVFSLTEHGVEIFLGVRGPGALLGEMSVFDNAPHSVSVGALEPLETLVVPVPDFLAFLANHPNATKSLVKMIISRLREADRKRIEFGTYDTLGRVVLRLLELAERFGTTGERGIQITLPLTQKELAGWTGSSREAVAKALRTLRCEGMIETHRRSMFVLDMDRLRTRVR